jgi:uncharacterized protein DUF4398
MLLRRLLLALALVAAIAGAACGTPPDKELQEAQTAIDNARSAGADQFAHDEFAAATDSLKRAHDAVNDRDYRMALNLALDARERAQNAGKEAARSKSAARRDAERALADASTALTAAKAALKSAEADKKPAKTLDRSRTEIADADNAVQEARTAFGAGNYAASIDRARQTTASLKGITKDLQTAAAAPARKRRPAPRRN